MNFKSFFSKYLMALAGVALIVIILNYVLDPLSFYRFPTLYKAQYSTNARFQLPGFIKNDEYDSIIVGTSLSRNFVESHVDQTMGVSSLNAAIPASTAREQLLAVQLAMNTQQLKNVIWEINFFSLARDPADVEDEQNAFPYHLWDLNPLNDYKYLFSLYPLELMLDIISANRKGSTLNRDREMLNKFGFDHEPLTIEEVAELTNIENAATSSDYEYEVMIENFKHNMLQVIANHPQLQFYVYYPPYPVFWHVRAAKFNQGYIDEITKTKIEIYKLLKDYENVKLYDFQHRADITHVVHHYMDIAHFFPSTNDYIIEALMNEDPISSLEEAEEQAFTAREQVLNFDVDKLIVDD